MVQRNENTRCGISVGIGNLHRRGSLCARDAAENRHAPPALLVGLLYMKTLENSRNVNAECVVVAGSTRLRTARPQAACG